jgi:hypothetical protein
VNVNVNGGLPPVNVNVNGGLFLWQVRQMMAEMKAAGKRKEAAKLKEEAEKAMKEADEAEAKEKAANK